MPIEQISEILDRALKAKSEDEFEIVNKTDSRALECLWLKIYIENNPSFNKNNPKDWSFEHLNEPEADAIHNCVLAEKSKCPCCGNELTNTDELFFRPSLALPTVSTIKTFKDVTAQYVMLCKDCAAIEKSLKK